MAVGCNQAGRGVVRGHSGWKAEAVRGNQTDSRRAVRSQPFQIVREMSDCQLHKTVVGHPLRGARLERVQARLRDNPFPHAQFRALGL